MKLLLVSIVTSLLMQTAFTQENSCPNNLLINGDFNNTSCGGWSPFLSNCVSNWSAVDGSPTIHNLGSNPFAWLWSHNGIGEAIAGNFNFIANTSYTISFDIFINGVNDNCTGVIANTSEFFIVATNAAGNITASPNGQIILNQPSTAYVNSWSNVSITFTPNINYSQIWIYPYKQINDNCQVNLSIDNICIKLNATNEGAYCCDGDNLVENGNFENGNIGFTSDYVQNVSTLPSQYNVSNTANNFGTTITDHSYCEDPTEYANNDSYLLVNGLTNQPTGSTSIIYETSVAVKPDKEYKFCAHFKNIPQCTFDIKPEIQLEINGRLLGWNTINSDATDPCDWYQISECFRSTEEKVIIKIHLKEDGLGDGNDLAIDDISIQQKQEQNLNITVQHQQTTQQIIGSVNSISTTDDTLLITKECLEENNGNNYYWFVYELSGYPFNGPIDWVNMVTSSFMWSSNTGGSSPNIWNLTTQFPGYPFTPNKLYVIGMYVPSCCDSCYDEAWAYQATFVNGRFSKPTKPFSYKEKEYIKSLFKKETINLEGKKTEKQTSLINLYPNPVEDILNIKSTKTLVNYQIINMLGKTVMSGNIKNNSIPVSNLASNMYFLKIKTKDGKAETLKFIKK